MSRLQKKVYQRTSSVLENCRLSLKQWLYMAYFLVHDCAGTRSVHMLGVGKATVAEWSQGFRLCVLNCEPTHSDASLFGWKDEEVETDECDIGRKRNGLHGHDTAVKWDFRSLFERPSDRIFIEPYDKHNNDEDDRRFGPPTVDNVRPLLGKLAEGSILYTDGARAYESLSIELGFGWSSVDHSSGG